MGGPEFDAGLAPGLAAFAQVNPLFNPPQTILTIYRDIMEAYETGDMETFAKKQPYYVESFDTLYKPYLEDRFQLTAAEQGAAMGYIDAPAITVSMYEAGNITNDALKGYLPDKENSMLSDVNSILWAEYLKIIMGQDIDTFEDAVQNWYDDGGSAVTEFVNEQ